MGWATLCLLQGSSGGVEASTLVPVVAAPDTPTSFPGLYTTSFIDSPFLSKCCPALAIPSH
jgi:hypothetical protein